MVKAPSRVDGADVVDRPDSLRTIPTSSSSTREQEIEATLKYLAQETGGKPLLNGNRTLALSTAREDTRSFYWLGFSPSWKHDDRSSTRPGGDGAEGDALTVRRAASSTSRRRGGVDDRWRARCSSASSRKPIR